MTGVTILNDLNLVLRGVVTTASPQDYMPGSSGPRTRMARMSCGGLVK